MDQTAAKPIAKTQFCLECDRYLPHDQKAELCERCAQLGLHENRERVLRARAYWQLPRGSLL